MTRTSLVLDDASRDALRRLARRLDLSQSEVVRRSLRLLEQRESALPASPKEALARLADSSAAGQSLRQVRAQARRMRRERHAAGAERE